MTTKIDVDKLVEELKRKPDTGQGYTTEYDGERGVIETPRFDTPPDSFDSILSEAGFDPELFEMTGPPVVKTWDAQTPDGVQRLFSYRLAVQQKRERVSVDDLVDIIHSKRGEPADRPRLELPSVFAVGDLQLGKSDGDGSVGTVGRFKASVAKAVERYRNNPTETVLIAFLGDLIEGYVSQGGRTAAFSDLTLTEQLRAMRHLATYAITEFREVCEDVHILTAAGNHGEGLRQPFATKPSDNYDVDVIRSVEEAFSLAGRGGVTFHYPQGEELAVAVELCGIKILAAHGHQWKKGQAFRWWQGQAFAQRTGWDASYLLAGHLHHLHIEASSERLFIQVPAMESQSDWWLNATGESGNPGAVYFIPGPGGQPVELSVV